MSRQTKFAALTIAVILAFGSPSFAQYRHGDDDGYYQGDHGQARQYGIQQGYRDGYEKGRHEGRENDPNDYQDPNWRQATRGYDRWMGPVEVFQTAYREGYRNGFQAGFRSLNRGWGDRDRDDDNGVYNRGGYINGQSDDGYGGNLGYRIGYQDGINQAREDASKNKAFNANPRGEYDDRDHGYHREYGDKSNYKARYSDGYRAGYESAFRRY